MLCKYYATSLDLAWLPSTWSVFNSSCEKGHGKIYDYAKMAPLASSCFFNHQNIKFISSLL